MFEPKSVYNPVNVLLKTLLTHWGQGVDAPPPICGRDLRPQIHPRFLSSFSLFDHRSINRQ
jgi:hypothetical protein